MIQSTKPIHILLVEDDDGDAKAIQRAFIKAKIANPISRAIDGIDAIEQLTGSNGKLKIRPPFLLMVDFNMPRMNGVEFVKHLRSHDEFAKSIIFMLSTSKRDEDKMAAYDLNVAGYIIKEKAGEDFLKLVDLMDSYWRIVEFP